MRAFAFGGLMMAAAFTIAAAGTAALLDRAHRFTHRVMHPAVFGCCAVDHPMRSASESAAEIAHG